MRALSGFADRRLLVPALCTLLLSVDASAQNSIDDVVLDEVIVTGEKIQRSWRETSSSVDVFDQNEIARRGGLDTTSDVLDRVPNLVGSETSNLAPAVRGVDGTGPAQGADAFFAGTRPRLNYQTDGRTLSYNESIFSDATLWDVERVEVFRGPQSTLQGRNAIAGAVVVKTNDPTYTPSGSVRIIGGEYDTQQYSGALSLPLVAEQLAVRVAVDQRRSDSYIDFSPYPAREHPGRYESLAVRGKVLIEPAALDDFSALITLNHVDGAAPQDTGVVRPFSEHVSSYPDMPVFATRANGAIADLNWDVSDAASLQAILSGTDITVHRYALEGDGNVLIEAQEFVAEPRVRLSLLDERLRGFVGVHYFRNTQDEYIDLFGGGTFDDSTTTSAVFGEAIFKATDTVDITFGARLEQEKRRRTGGTGPFLIDFDETYEVALPKIAVAWRASDAVTVGGVIARGYNGGGAGFTYDVPFVSYVYEPEFLWNYELYGRAQLADGRLTLTGNVFFNDYKDMQLPFDLNPDPDLWSYVVRNADEAQTYGVEVGARLAALQGLELFANLGLLQTEVTNYPGSGIESNELTRAPAATFDLGFSYERSSGFEIAIDGRYLDAYYSDVLNDPNGQTDAFWLANARIGYRFAKARVFASVTNLFDSVTPILLTPGATRDEDIANLADPRTVTAGVQISF